MLNWRPVDYELREIEFDRSEIVHEQRMMQLRKDDEQRKIEHEQRMKQLKSENERLAELNAKRVRDVISLLEEYGGMA